MRPMHCPISCLASKTSLFPTSRWRQTPGCWAGVIVAAGGAGHAYLCRRVAEQPEEGSGYIVIRLMGEGEQVVVLQFTSFVFKLQTVQETWGWSGRFFLIYLETPGRTKQQRRLKIRWLSLRRRDGSLLTSLVSHTLTCCHFHCFFPQYWGTNLSVCTKNRGQTTVSPWHGPSWEPVDRAPQYVCLPDEVGWNRGGRGAWFRWRWRGNLQVVLTFFHKHRLVFRHLIILNMLIFHFHLTPVSLTGDCTIATFVSVYSWCSSLYTAVSNESKPTCPPPHLCRGKQWCPPHTNVYLYYYAEFPVLWSASCFWSGVRSAWYSHILQG